ncbi:hypothetical protein KGA65_01835 [Ideonella sp. B7]|uniref:hypothetical protein n=1 Tax=Ideonella benzenivorans TaxID=2831643 RepID=UPI001CECB49F|nr:hypothetical protein [Ideonella benzenivorans]MCA6215272.1 hypothetical protein [Ideonella benzenivorans]
MPDSADTPRLARAHELTLTLRSLQRRLNQTVDALCGLAAGEVAEAVPAPAHGEDWGPALFSLPLVEPVRLQPASGTALGPGAIFYVGEHQGVLQLVQAPVSGVGAPRYACRINFADFDGEWMSLVFDLRPLLETVLPGQTRLVLWAEHERLPAQALQVRCSWRSEGGELQVSQAGVEAGEPVQLSLDLGWLQPASLQVLDLHLIFPAAGRGTITLRGMQASMHVQPVATTGGDPDVFEETP